LVNYWKYFWGLFFYYTSFIPLHVSNFRKGLGRKGKFSLSPRVSDLFVLPMKDMLKMYQESIFYGAVLTVIFILSPFHPLGTAVNLIFIAMTLGWWVAPIFMEL